jgi:hypothetical protein
VRLFVEGTIIIRVPFITLFPLKAFLLLVLAFYPVVRISTVDGVTQITIIPITPSVTLLRWCETADRVHVGTLPVVKLMTTGFIIAVVA